MEQQKKFKVLKRHYVVKIGDNAIKVKQNYAATDLTRLLLNENYTITVSFEEHECEMTQQEINIARAQGLELFVINDYNYSTPCGANY